MKVYIVAITNNEPYEDNITGNDAVFASREAAEQYIKDRPEIYRNDQNRIHELRQKLYYTLDEQLTEEEQAELEFLQKRWTGYWISCPVYWIEEFEVLG